MSVASETTRHLAALKNEHRSLNDSIDQLALDGYYHELELKRMKKRRLELKDAIARLESRLIPDLNA